MPVKITKKKSGCYEVRTPHMVHAKCTSKENAQKVSAILHMWENGTLKRKKK